MNETIEKIAKIIEDTMIRLGKCLPNLSGDAIAFILAQAIYLQIKEDIEAKKEIEEFKQENVKLRNKVDMSLEEWIEKNG